MQGKVFPLLTVNQLLRTRRACKWTKGNVDEHLRRHPRSSTTVTLLLDSGLSWKYDKLSTLPGFLREEELVPTGSPGNFWHSAHSSHHFTARMTRTWKRILVEFLKF